MYIERGSVELVIDNESLSAGVGDLLFFDMMRKHTVKNCSCESVHIDYFYFFGPNVGKFHDSIGGQSIIHGYEPSVLREAVSLLTPKIRGGREDIYETSRLIYRFLTDLLAQLPNFDAEDRISEIIEFLEVHYTENHSANELAEMAHMSKYYFIRQFHSRTGSSPKEFVGGIRLAKSQNLLLNTSMSILEIATSVGFSDSRALLTLYQSKLGCTPTEYRESNKASE